MKVHDMLPSPVRWVGNHNRYTINHPGPDIKLIDLPPSATLHLLVLLQSYCSRGSRNWQTGRGAIFWKFITYHSWQSQPLIGLCSRGVQESMLPRKILKSKAFWPKCGRFFVFVTLNGGRGGGERLCPLWRRHCIGPYKEHKFKGTGPG